MSRKYKDLQCRDQGSLFSVSLDELVHDDHPIRALDAYIDSLDMFELGFANTQINKKSSGQPAYPSSALFKLYLYGYLNRIKSSRLLEKECHRNIEVMWLLQGLKPSYKTISDFRSRNKQAIRKAHKAFILFCHKLSLFGGRCIAVDGSYFSSDVSKRSFKSKKQLEKQIKRVNENIENWLASVENTDQEENDDSTATLDYSDPEIQEKLKKIEALKKNREQLVQDLNYLEQQYLDKISTTDPEAGLLNKGAGAIAGYNVQIVTDDKHRLIIADDISNENDAQQLFPMSVLAKAVFKTNEPLNVLADKGYFGAAQIAACVEDGITPYVPVVELPKNGRFEKSDFTYNESKDECICPNEKALKKSGKPRHNHGQYLQRYRASETDCKNCPLRNQCITEKSKCREIWLIEHEQVMIEHKKRMEENPDSMKKRSGMVEHPFGTIKVSGGWNSFLLRGRQKVLAELSLYVMTYNIKRLIQIMGVKKLLEAIKRASFFRRYLRGVVGLYQSKLKKSFHLQVL